MNSELEAPEKNKTQVIALLPAGKTAIASKQVYKIKYAPNGIVDRLKARLVAKGCNQQFGVDFYESFNPVAKTVTVRTIIAIVAIKNQEIHQVDINDAYLHELLEEDIYLQPPLGYTKTAPGQVCKLIKSLYGLKQAGRQWNKELIAKLISLRFQKSQHDHCLFTKQTEKSFLALVVYVDDILITGSNFKEIQAVKQHLHPLFTIKDLGQASYFLSVEMTRTAAGITISQTKYARDILLDAGLMEARPAQSPLPHGLDLTVEGTKLTDPETFRRIIGRLLGICQA